MAKTFMEFIIGFVLAGLVIVALINFGIMTQVDNGVNNTIFNDPHYGSAFNDSFNRIYGNVSSSENIASDQNNATSTEDPSVGLTINLVSILPAMRNFFSMAFGTLGSIISLVTRFIFTPTIVASVIIAIVLITGIFLIWRALRVGE